MHDERLYAQVVEELKRQGPITGLWAKAYAEANGSKPQAEALYLRYRVEQLAEAEKKSSSAIKSKNDDLESLYAKFDAKLTEYIHHIFGVLVIITIIIALAYWPST